MQVEVIFTAHHNGIYSFTLTICHQNHAQFQWATLVAAVKDFQIGSLEAVPGDAHPKPRDDLIITYPPDFDGELWIQVDDDGQNYVYRFVRYCQGRNETAAVVLGRTIQDIKEARAVKAVGV